MSWLSLPCIWLGKWQPTTITVKRIPSLPPGLLSHPRYQHSLGLFPEIKSPALIPASTPFAQKQVSAGQYGPGMSELEKQIAEHNILQKEIEAYGLQIKNVRSGVRCPPSPPCSCWLCLGPCRLCSSAPLRGEYPPLFCRGHRET